MAERISSAGNSDVLEQVLDVLRFRGSIFFRSGLAAPWGMSLEELGRPRFHISMSGSFYIGGSGLSAPQRVEEMEIILLTGGFSHWIADQPGRPLVPGVQAYESCELGSPLFQFGDITNSVICGQVRFDETISHPFLDTLPPIIHIPHIERKSPLWQLVELIDAETTQGLHSNSYIVDRLVEALFLMLLRQHARQADSHSGFLGALNDHRIHKALTLIHQKPERPWTIDDMAASVGMSRTTLVRKFRDQVGVAPIEYLTSWRLIRARDMMSNSGKSLEKIAEEVGYSSAQTLARAFKRHFGYSTKVARET